MVQVPSPAMVADPPAPQGAPITQVGAGSAAAGAAAGIADARSVGPVPHPNGAPLRLSPRAPREEDPPAE